MSLTLIPTAIGGVQAAVASASITKNILAGLYKIGKERDLNTLLNEDIGGFTFDYIGEERLEAGTQITDHYTEDNQFMQDHVAVKPTMITMRGFVAETVYNRKSFIPTLLALSSALAPVSPYLGGYSAGATEKMNEIITQSELVINQLATIQSTYGSIKKLVGVGSPSKIQSAYTDLDALRTGGGTFAVVTPWKTFKDMMIDNLVMVSPEITRGWADITVRLKEIRVAPSLLVETQDNSRGSDVETLSGAEGKD